MKTKTLLECSETIKIYKFSMDGPDKKKREAEIVFRNDRFLKIQFKFDTITSYSYEDWIFLGKLSEEIQTLQIKLMKGIKQ